MCDSTDPADSSVSESGEVLEVPADPFSITLTNDEDKVAGVLQKWGDAAWIYADADDLEPVN